MSDYNPLLNQLVHALEEIKAINITVLDVRSQTTITDYMLICTGQSSRHIKAITEQTASHMKLQGLSALSVTGVDTGDWALIDFGDFVVHVMSAQSRAFYNLEGLWQNQAS